MRFNITHYKKFIYLYIYLFGFANNVQGHYHFSKKLQPIHLTNPVDKYIDKQLPSFLGHCSFGQQIPNKPSKIWFENIRLVNSKSFYFVNLEIYSVKYVTGPEALRNKAVEVVHRLGVLISRINRNASFDNQFTSCCCIW